MLLQIMCLNFVHVCNKMLCFELGNECLNIKMSFRFKGHRLKLVLKSYKFPGNDQSLCREMSDVFFIQNCLKQGYTLSHMNTIRKVQENQEGL
jgi:hypothetical protein